MTVAATAGAVVAADAVVAETAAADRTDGSAESSGGELPPLVPLTASLLIVTALRAAIAIAALVALVYVFGHERTLRLTFVASAALLAIAALARARGSSHFGLRKTAEPWPADARRASWGMVALRAAYPSTIGLAALIAIAAPISATLAALLAGFELGLALMSLVIGAENAYWEHAGRATIGYAPGVRARFFARPRA
jgi:hypothetical protein